MPPKASQKLICVGKILGAHGVRGLARLGSHTTEPKDFAAYGPVFDKTGARSWTLSLNSWNKTHFIGALSGVNTREDVEKLKGTDLYIPRDLLPDTKGDGYYYADLIGLEARAAAVMEKGRGVYLSKCAICHGNDGMGDKVTYPPLAGSEWLKEKPDVEIVRIILQGLTGPITVNGKEWDSTMLPPGVTDSRDLANLLTFLRRQFGGVEKAAYTPEQVDAIRREL